MFFSFLAVLSAAAQREVPRIDIKLADGITITDLESSKKTWRRAQITITAAGIGKNITDSAKVRGRGNTTWSMKKKPFRFKFDKKQSPFGLAKSGTLTTATPSATALTSCPSTSKPPKSKTM